nr:hypothetical protein Itr_chr10CG14340 [Ipomoea trifida]GLL49603.1 hypothetical protein Itr_chr15CG11890 [Ipomoea trifida]
MENNSYLLFLVKLDLFGNEVLYCSVELLIAQLINRIRCLGRNVDGICNSPALFRLRSSELSAILRCYLIHTKLLRLHSLRTTPQTSTPRNHKTQRRATP